MYFVIGDFVLNIFYDRKFVFFDCVKCCMLMVMFMVVYFIFLIVFFDFLFFSMLKW